MKKYFTWFWKSWPLPIVPIVLLIYYALVSKFPVSHSGINNWYGATLQILGGMQILWSVDKNLRGFKNQSIVKNVVEWFKSFPLFTKSRTVIITGVGGITLGGLSGRARAKLVYDDIAQKVEYLERQIDLLHDEFDKRMDEFDSKLKRQGDDMEAKLADCNKKLSELKILIEDVAVGDILGQVTGILIVIIGTVISAL